MGFGDIERYNPASLISTPNLNALCDEGMKFTDAHTNSSVCTPTRYGLMTGRYCWRTRLKKHVLSGYSDHLIDPFRSTVASLAKSKGYNTAVIGKWHLGVDFNWQGDTIPNKIIYIINHFFSFLYGPPTSFTKYIDVLFIRSEGTHRHAAIITLS